MNKKIIYEIYRQQQLMGVDKKILKENKYVELGSDLIKSFFNTSKKAIKDVVDDVMVGGVRVKKQVLDDIIAVLDDPSLFNALSKGEKEIFGQIVSQNQGLVDDIYEQLMSEVMSSTSKSEKGLVEFISNRIQNGQKISDVLTDLNGEEDVFLNEVLIQKFAQKIRDLKTDKFVTEVETKNLKKFVDPTTGRVWEAPEYVAQIDRELSKFQKILQKSGVSAATKWLKNAMKLYEPFFLQYIRNWYSNLIFNWKNVQLQNIKKAKQFVNNAYKLQSEGKDGDAVRELQKALSYILISKKEPGYNVDVIINAFIKENPNLSKTTKDLFLNSKTDPASGKTIRDFIQDIADDAHEQVMKPIKTEIKSFGEMIPGVSSFLNKDLNLVNSAKDLITTPARRWFNTITWKDPRSAYEIILGMAKRGVNKEVSARILSYFLANVLVIPALISLVKTWGNQIESSAKATYLEALKKLCDEKIITSGCTEINQELNDIKFMFSEDYVKNYLASLPVDLGKMFGGESWDNSEYKNLFFMTYWDDLFNAIYDIVQGSPFPFIGKPKANKLLKLLEDKNSEAYQELIKLGINPKAEDLEAEIIKYYTTHTSPEDRAKVDEVINKVEDKKNEVIGKIENTPEGFENFIKSKGLTLKTKYIVGGVGQTNEPDPNGAKTTNWWFNKNTNTFESY
jgi:hypothetical protein